MERADAEHFRQRKQQIPGPKVVGNFPILIKEKKIFMVKHHGLEEWHLSGPGKLLLFCFCFFYRWQAMVSVSSMEGTQSDLYLFRGPSG